MVRDLRPQGDAFVSESIDVRAKPRVLYDAVSDVCRMGEWSPESTGAHVQTPGPIRAGTRFRGSNRKGLIRWSTQCIVIEAVPAESFCFDVTVLGVPVARWRYNFVPMDSEITRVTETWSDKRFGPVGLVARLAGGLLLGTPNRAKRNRETMQVTLNNLKDVLENSGSTT